MPVNIRPSVLSAALPTVWSKRRRCGVKRGTESIAAFAASMRESWSWERAMISDVSACGFYFVILVADVRNFQIFKGGVLGTSEMQNSVW